MKTLTFDQGDIIFRQGDYSATMYDILSGKVGIYADYDGENKRLISVLEDSQVLGELGMIEVYPRSATAIALENGTALAEITEEELSDYFRNKPEKLLEIMKNIAGRIRETDEKYLNACRAVYENEEATRNGTEKNEWLEEQLTSMCKEYMFCE